MLINFVPGGLRARPYRHASSRSQTSREVASERPATKLKMALVYRQAWRTLAASSRLWQNLPPHWHGVSELGNTQGSVLNYSKKCAPVNTFLVATACTPYGDGIRPNVRQYQHPHPDRSPSI